MTNLAEGAFRRAIVGAVAGFFVIGFAATVTTLVDAFRSRDEELIRSTEEVNGLVSRIYAFREAKGKYPRSLAELRPIPGDVVSKHGKSHLGEDEDFYATWCWTYHHRAEVAPPFLSRPVAAHTKLVYEFAPSSRSDFPKNVDEGWVITSEGSKRYLKSFLKPPR
jgi:hypothetical protein